MRIVVIGTGHMGSWFVRELSKEHEVAVYDIDKEKMKGIKNVRHLENLSEIPSFKPEFLINAVSLKNTIKAFEAVTKYLPPHCIISDIASIKCELPEYYRKCDFRYASIHPMFGPRFANFEKLKKENVIILKESDESAKHFFRGLFEKHGLNIFEYSFDEHDRLMAYSLTLPFSSSIVFSACVTTKTVPGTTFAKHREIAQKLLEEDDYLLAEVLFNPYSLKQIENVISRLEFLKDVIRTKNYEKAIKFFDKLRENLQ